MDPFRLPEKISIPHKAPPKSLNFPQCRPVESTKLTQLTLIFHLCQIVKKPTPHQGRLFF